MNRPRTNKLQLFEKKVVHFVSCVGCGGAGAPNRLLGEGCLSGKVALHLGVSSLAILFGTEAEGPVGPRTGKHGFGHFCRNKSDSSRGRESPHKTILLRNLDYRKHEGYMRKEQGLWIRKMLLEQGHEFGFFDLSFSRQ